MGHVGKAMYDLTSPYAEIVTYDAATDEKYPAPELAGCAVGIICVDTPIGENGACDISRVSDAVRRLPIDTVLIKSTIAPGTTDFLARVTGKQVCFSPEYFGESNFQRELWPGGTGDIPFIIMGGAPQARAKFIDLLQPILGPGKVYFQCTAVEAEIIKYMENAYFAVKVTFVNEFRNICRAFDVDWHTVREGWLLDPRVERDHSAAFADVPGFGGKCLPKDLSAIIRAATEAGYDPALLAEVLRINQRLRGVEDLKLDL
jgi:UDPglucose 6-dehydrogenase